MFVFSNMINDDYIIQIEDNAQGHQRIGEGVFTTTKKLVFNFADVLEDKPILGPILHSTESILQGPPSLQKVHALSQITPTTCQADCAH